jgi:hypothetical protein
MIIAMIMMIPIGWYPVDKERGIPPGDTPTARLSEYDLEMFYRQGHSECMGMGDALEDCVKGVTSTVFARMVYDDNMDGGWYLSDGTVYGTFSVMSGDMPQFTPWNWDANFCVRNPDHKFCVGPIDLSPYFTPVQAAINGDGGPCAGFLFYGHEPPPDPDAACAVVGAQTMYFHNGWGWTEGLEPGEWTKWKNE